MSTRTKADMPPFPDGEAANKALTGFLAAVSAARQEYGIHDLVVIAKFATVLDGQVGEAQMAQSYGSQWDALPMVAQAYGQLLTEQRSELMRLRAPKIQGGGHDG